jgi:hypothetical protein
MYKDYELPPDSVSTVVGVASSSQSRGFATGESLVTVPESTPELAFNEVVLDDDARFSTVPLTAREGPRIHSRMSFFEKIQEIRRRSADSTQATFAPSPKQELHKRTLSNSSSSNPHAELDVSDGNAHEADFLSQRANFNDLQKLQGEPAHPHNERQEEEIVINGAIDWGMWHLDSSPIFQGSLPPPRLLGRCDLW